METLEPVKPSLRKRFAKLVCHLTITGSIFYLGLMVANNRPTVAHPHHQPAANQIPTYEFRNGLWFDGKDFRSKVLYSVEGTFTEKKPPLVDKVLDLDGGYVVSPFGEAHNHNIVHLSHLERTVPRYLSDGIFYVKIANGVRESTDKLKSHINTPAGIDIVFANGGITASGGHPVKLYEEHLREGPYGHVEKFWFNDRAYYIVDSEDDLEKKWPLIRSSPPNFIKAFLYYSEEFDKRRDDPAFSGKRGLDPRLLPKIVERAHKESLRVAVHVETAADFHTAVAAGVDEIAHLPGYNIPESYPVSVFQISPEDAQIAARRRIYVVTTTMLAKTKVKSPEQLKTVQANQLRNLRLLHGSGVRLALGSDTFTETSVAEARYLREIGAFDNCTLLRLWSETTPQAIFPERKIGRLAEGYEASFLVLAGDPIEEFENTRKIRLRFKQGRPLDLGPESASRVAGNKAGR
jgi:hypothetical protein